MAEATPINVEVNAQLEASIADLKAKNEAAAKELADLKAAQAAADAEREAKSLIDAARAERKLTPALAATAETVAKSGIEPLKAFLAALPATAPDGGSVSTPKATEAALPKVRHASDHVGVAMHAYKSETAPAHMAAVEFMERANASGKQISYYDAVVAVTRR